MKNCHITDFCYELVPLRRKTPLRISRGISGDTVNIWVRIESEGIEGWGAACPFSTGAHTETAGRIIETLDRVAGLLSGCSPFERQHLSGIFSTELKDPPAAAMAAVDTALLDWLGKRMGIPLWRLWGLDRSAIPPMSVTVGMEEPDTARRIVNGWLKGAEEHRFRMLKVKLGSPGGIDTDKKRTEAVLEEAAGASVIVDANGGWNLEDAVEMCRWLGQKGVSVVEQPLRAGAVEDWRSLYQAVPVKLFADESCFTAEDVYRLACHVDGVVVKMMKCGGLSEALKIIHAARAAGLSVMLGCYADCALTNSAMAQIAPLADYIDLDSHLNMENDPFEGARVRDGRLVPADMPGIGVELKDD